MDPATSRFKSAVDNSAENVTAGACAEEATPEAARHLTRTPPRVLLVGYNGANNTGAEALLLSDIEDVRAVLGPDAKITVPTLNEANLRRYVREGPNLRIAPIPTLYFQALHRLVRESDLVLLVEGSTYMDTWTPVLLWAYLWASRCAHALGKPCLAYAVDAGELSRLDRWLVRRVASNTDLIVARSRGAAERLHSWGVTAPIEVTADNAFNFRPSEADLGWVQREWPEVGEGLVGIAAVDVTLWPVVVRPWGRAEDCYRWPYYFSRSPERSGARDSLAATYAALADRLVAEHGKSVALIGMEQLDEPFGREIQRRMVHADRARVFSSRAYSASQLTILLRNLDLLVTSRYHASVLSLAARVPQIAVGHDLRLKTLYDELGLAEEYFLTPHDPTLGTALAERAEQLLAAPEPIRAALGRAFADLTTRAQRNRALLRAFVEARGWKAVG
jgi:polysaccharide pyruvyl transferase WcaK-like protein